MVFYMMTIRKANRRGERKKEIKILKRLEDQSILIDIEESYNDEVKWVYKKVINKI